MRLYCRSWYASLNAAINAAGLSIVRGGGGGVGGASDGLKMQPPIKAAVASVMSVVLQVAQARDMVRILQGDGRRARKYTPRTGAGKHPRAVPCDSAGCRVPASSYASVRKRSRSISRSAPLALAHRPRSKRRNPEVSTPAFVIESGMQAADPKLEMSDHRSSRTGNVCTPIKSHRAQPAYTSGGRGDANSSVISYCTSNRA